MVVQRKKIDPITYKSADSANATGAQFIANLFTVFNEWNEIR